MSASMTDLRKRVAIEVALYGNRSTNLDDATDRILAIAREHYTGWFRDSIPGIIDAVRRAEARANDVYAENPGGLVDRINAAVAAETAEIDAAVNVALAAESLDHAMIRRAMIRRAALEEAIAAIRDARPMPNNLMSVPYAQDVIRALIDKGSPGDARPWGDVP